MKLEGGCYCGEVRYVVRDAFGREQSTSSPYFMSASLLGKGISDYTYSVGAQRNAFGTKSFDYGKLSFLGTHRYGVTNHLTAGGRLASRQGPVRRHLSLAVVPRRVPGFSTKLLERQHDDPQWRGERQLGVSIRRH